tara:strand:+ start:408 stop:746 length:339 start_codon:yes stop_codon:yes gene_type:complete
MAKAKGVDVVLKTLGSIFKYGSTKGNAGKIFRVVWIGAGASLIFNVKDEIVEGISDLSDLPDVTIDKIKDLLNFLLGYDRNGDGKIDFTEYGVVQYGLLAYAIYYIYGKIRK